MSAMITRLKNYLIAGLLLAALTFLFAGLASASAAEFGPEDAQALDRITEYLNGIETAEGSFFQIAPDGSTDQGTFYLRKPGRVRFEYAAPNPNLIVADGSTIAIENSELKTTDRYPLTDSPIRLLLSDDVDLASDERIASVRREPGVLSVTARQEDGMVPGQITIEFIDNGTNLDLRQWEIIDAQGLRTIIAVTELRKGVTLSPALFLIEDQNPFGRQEF
jgi:outer membrane lipoprotein-sorting protein